jgi:phage terminase large subunit
LRRAGLTPIDANNEILDGIQIMTTEMQKGNFYILNTCTNLIKEIETYVWDAKKSERGDDEPMKKDDHAIDACRYALATHKVMQYDPYKHKEMADEWMRNKYDIHRK